VEDPILAVIKLVLQTCPAATLTLRADPESVLLEVRFVRENEATRRLMETIDLKLDGFTALDSGRIKIERKR